VADIDAEADLNSTYMFNYTGGPMTVINLRKAVTLAIDRGGAQQVSTTVLGTVSV
jgi:hypothetical protein